MVQASHLAISSPALLSFVRAYLWQLERTGKVPDSEDAEEQQAAKAAAQALYSTARSREQLWRLFGEFKQHVEQRDGSGAPSEQLRSVMEKLGGAPSEEAIPDTASAIGGSASAIDGSASAITDTASAITDTASAITDTASAITDTASPISAEPVRADAETVAAADDGDASDDSSDELTSVAEVSSAEGQPASATPRTGSRRRRALR
ncbi:MAG: hypothetical protein JNM83_17690 [Myxococcales bacterium]|nr:hypothetical protein [Myxococcales bacterium]